MRKIKDSMNRFLLGPDPGTDEANTLWGIDTVVSTVITAEDGILVDTTKMGRLAVREVSGLRVGYSGTDLVQNVLRSVAEQRLNLAIERPSSICYVKKLPTS
jgi:hypothetical protein